MALATSTIMAGIAIGGIATSAYGRKKQSKAFRQISQAEIRAENAREKQMELENKRKQRDILRNAQVVRANSLSKVSGSGADTKGSSAWGGVVGQVNTDAGQQILASAQNTMIGREIFQANREASFYRGEAATAGAIADTGSQIANSAVSIAKIGTSLFN